MTTRRRLRFFVPVPVLAVAAVTLPLSAPEPAPARPVGEVAYHSLPEKPSGRSDRDRSGVETSAIELAVWLEAVPDGPGSSTACGRDSLRVSWDDPPATATHGAFVAPLGPAPDARTDAVNGIVQCAGSEAYAFMGFQARYADDRWDVVATPFVGEEAHLPEVTGPEAQAPSVAPAPAVTLDGRVFGAAIEGLAAYEPQRTCDGTAKPGTMALRNLLLRDNRGTRNLGIVRGCGIGGTSEHKEGRAFDWGVNARNPSERAAADAFVAKLLATDEHGNRYALARRMGVMYVIWNQRIWSAYRAAEGWRPYHGASAHTDHVHISLSWAGAQARTSFWSGNVVEVLLASAPTGTGARPAAVAVSAPARRHPRSTPVATAPRAAPRSAPEPSGPSTSEARRARLPADRAAGQRAREEREAAEQAQGDAARAESKARREAEKAARDQAEQEAKARWASERPARDAARAEARRLAAEKAAADRAARGASRQRWRSRPTTTVPMPTTAATPVITEPTTTTTSAVGG